VRFSEPFFFSVTNVLITGALKRTLHRGAVSEDQPTLDYSLSKRRLPWRRIIVIGVLVIAALVLSPMVMHFSERWKRRSPFLSIQKQCMNLSFPPTQVAYEEDHQQAQILSGGKTSGQGWRAPPSESGGALYFYLQPDLIADYHDWDASGPVMDYFTSFLFLHARQAKGGPERLVHVGVNQIFSLRAVGEGKLSPGKAEEQHVLDWQVIRPGTLFSPAANVASGSWGNNTLEINMPKPLRLYAGQPDPADASHFTINAVTANGGTLIIDGYLQTNDQITFAIHP
jgi:hypothetical protein